jgi:hypothetical protein
LNVLSTSLPRHMTTKDAMYSNNMFIKVGVMIPWFTRGY